MITRAGRTGGAATGLVLVHGRGDSARGILGLGEALALPDIALAAPEAPGNSWWPTSFLAPAAQMEPFVQQGIAAIDHAIAALVRDGVPPNRIALAGFSQGACLALEYAARKGGVRAVFGLSGGLVGTGDATGDPDESLYGHGPKRFDYTTDLTGLPVLIAVHERDPHIPLKRTRDSAGIFRSLGADVTAQTYPGPGHQVMPDAIAAIRADLNR